KQSSIDFALTVSPTVSTTFVEQFWTSAKSKTINNVRHITAKVAGKSVSISEASIRSDLLFDDADGIDSLPNQAIFDAIQLMGINAFVLQVNCCAQRPSPVTNFDHFKNQLVSSFQKIPIKLQAPQATIKKTSVELLHAITDSVFQFIDQPSLPSQSNFDPVEEIGEGVYVDDVQGMIPHGFPEGVYIRNGSNPLFGGLKSTESIFGKSSHIWVEGEGMLHALYFMKESDGKYYSVSENHMPQEINIRTLKTLRNWDVDESWNRPFTAHPKKAPGSGELVMMGVDAMKPFFEIGIISADGSKLVHKADLEFKRCSLCHDVGVTMRYNVILDFPLTIDIKRLANGGPLIKYEEDGYARIGVMPRYGDASSVRWFQVDTCCVFHIINTYEDGNEVILWAFRARNSIIPGPDLGLNKFEWFSSRFTNEMDSNLNANESLFSQAYEWRLNMETGEVKERFLTGNSHSMDFPMINENFTGLKNKYGYAQTVDLDASRISGMAKFGGLMKLYLDDTNEQDYVKMEFHKFPKNTFCTGAAFVAKPDGLDEDDGWVITFVHDEYSNISRVIIVNAKKFTSEPVAIITLPSRVPYGFHGAFMPINLNYTEKDPCAHATRGSGAFLAFDVGGLSVGHSGNTLPASRKLNKFEGNDFSSWQKKMHFLLATLKVVYVLSTPMPEFMEDETLDQTRRRCKWENDDYICRRHILNIYIAEDASSKKFLFTQHGLKMDESVIVSTIIDKLTPSWKDFKHSLKHNKDELSLIQLGRHFVIEESIRAKESGKGKGKEIDGSSSVNMIEDDKNKNNNKNTNGKKRNNDGNNDGSNKKSKLTCWKCGKMGHYKKDCRVKKNNGGNTSGSGQGSKEFNSSQGLNFDFDVIPFNHYVSHIYEICYVQDDAFAWWIDSGATCHAYKVRCWFDTFHLMQDGSALHTGDE
ncbi:carotenoid 9,10(9',10')-cleavage dioxygenase 1-like protein, partial [Tanacetum coccineum]